MSQPAGRIQSIGRYPIKSFQGESVERALLQDSGIFADRPLALRDAASGKIVSGKHQQLGQRILEFSARYSAEPEPSSNTSRSRTPGNVPRSPPPTDDHAAPSHRAMLWAATPSISSNSPDTYSAPPEPSSNHAKSVGNVLISAAIVVTVSPSHS